MIEPFAALDATGALVDGREVGVEVAGVAAAAGDFLARGGDLAQRLAVVGHVGEDDEHVHVALERQVLGGGERHARGRDALDGRVVGEVEEEHRALDGRGACGTRSMKKSASSKVMPIAANTTANSPSSLSPTFVGLVAAREHGRLARDLRGELVVRQTASPRRSAASGRARAG